jgi:hypothetical protein
VALTVAPAQTPEAPPEETPTQTSIRAAEVPSDTQVQRQAGSLAVTRGKDTPMAVTLPAPYWEFRNRQELARAMEENQGCGGSPDMMEELVWGMRHKDAPVQMQCLESSYRFLLRDEAGLEDFINERLEFVMAQLGESVDLLDRGFVGEGDPGNPVVHSVSFDVPAQAGSAGGCGQQPPEQDQGPGYVVVLVDFFVRPKGQDLIRYELRCYAPKDAYEDLKEEIEFILGSVEYQGELADGFFAPDAPDDKLPGEEEVEESPGGGGKMGFMVAAFVIAVIWMIMRRRKSGTEGSAS